jgi:hypothetical protein
VPLGQAAPCASCRIVPMLSIASGNPTTLHSSPYGPIFPFLLEREPKLGRSSFPKKSKPIRNTNWILKRNLKDLILNFKDPFVLNFDLNL